MNKEFREGDCVFIDDIKDCYVVYEGRLVEYKPYYDKDNW